MSKFVHPLHEAPSAADADLAAVGSSVLARYPATGNPARLRLVDSNTDITVPAQVIGMLVDILEQMATGQTVYIMPGNRELTTQEAAELLNVSRPYLINQLLKPGRLPFHKVGNRRKIPVKDVLLYKAQQDAETDRIMAEIATLSQSVGIVGS